MLLSQPPFVFRVLWGQQHISQAVLCCATSAHSSEPWARLCLFCVFPFWPATSLCVSVFCFVFMFCVAQPPHIPPSLSTAFVCFRFDRRHWMSSHRQCKLDRIAAPTVRICLSVSYWTYKSRLLHNVVTIARNRDTESLQGLSVTHQDPTYLQVEELSSNISGIARTRWHNWHGDWAGRCMEGRQTQWPCQGPDAVGGMPVGWQHNSKYGRTMRNWG